MKNCVPSSSLTRCRKGCFSLLIPLRSLSVFTVRHSPDPSSHGGIDLCSRFLKTVVFHLLLFTLLPGVAQAAAQPQPSEILGKLSAYFRSLGGYRVAFEVTTDDGLFPGYYTVGGDHYYMVLGDAEVYGEGDTRYEVDNNKHEVVVDRVDTSGHNLLNNPTRAFDFVNDEFSAEVLKDADGLTTVRLTPREPNAAISAIDVVADTVTGKPRSVSYLFDGERITIAIRSVTAETSPPAAFDKAKYAGYELIDFR